ncbi:unnamed protein product [Hanseniaspora opuntiae]
MSLVDTSQDSSDENDLIIVDTDPSDKRSISPIVSKPTKRQKINTNQANPNDVEECVLLVDDQVSDTEDDLDEQIIEDSDVEIIEKPDTAANKTEWAKTQNGDNEVLCIICYGDVEDATVTKCGHVYCFKCLHEYVNKGYVECAVCRQKLNLKLNKVIKMKYKVVPSV